MSDLAPDDPSYGLARELLLADSLDDLREGTPYNPSSDDGGNHNVNEPASGEKA